MAIGGQRRGQLPRRAGHPDRLPLNDKSGNIPLREAKSNGDS
jgi:hypothetical protein